MNDGRRGVHAAIDWATLHTVFGVLHSLLIRSFCNGNTLNAYGITRGIHHDEHVFQAAVFFAYQEANGATVVAILQDGCRAGFDAHFVFDADAVDVIALTKAAIGIDHELRHHKQTDTFHTFGSTLNTRQHQVNDVVGHVMLTIGDVDFGAKNFKCPIGQRFCARANQSQIRTCLRLCQVHGASPLTRDQFLEVNVFQIVRARCQECFNGAICQQGA